MWGSSGLIANTILNTRLISQDCVDPINGEEVSLGATSLTNLFYKLTNIPYKTGARLVQQTTNTAQTDTSIGGLLDWYNGGPVANPGYCAPNVIAIPQTQGAANVVNTWVATGIAPATAIPNGKYAILGAYNSLSVDPIWLRFSHADFSGLTPGFPVGASSFASDILGHQKVNGGHPLMTDGYQFVDLSTITGKPCCPVFTVSNAGTGLQQQVLAAVVTDTPRLSVNIAKVG
jgi:hypothetical protein